MVSYYLVMAIADEIHNGFKSDKVIDLLVSIMPTPLDIHFDLTYVSSIKRNGTTN